MSSKSLGDNLINAGYIALASPVIAAAVVAAPVIGLLAQPILAIQALYYAISQTFHYNKTKDKHGITLSGDIDPLTNVPRYMDWDMKFDAIDLTRLKHERDRLKAREGLSNTWVSVKEFAKLMIPIFGLKWHFQAEKEKINNSNSKFDPIKIYDDLAAIEHHIKLLNNGEDFWKKFPLFKH